MTLPLNRFVYHARTQTSQTLKYREFKTIDQAFTAAAGEKKMSRLTYSTRFRKICRETNHSLIARMLREKTGNLDQSNINFPTLFATKMSVELHTGVIKIPFRVPIKRPTILFPKISEVPSQILTKDLTILPRSDKLSSV